jgi:hypothetical protein
VVSFDPSVSFFRTYADAGADLQTPFDVTVVMPTILRPSIVDALISIFAQDLRGRIQILIGVDQPANDIGVIDRAVARRASHCCVNVFYPGYSTSVRHGGVHPGRDCGALRCLLSYLANSRYIAYLDDDNWWAPDHLSSLRAAIEAAQWAYSLRWFVHHETRRPVCIDSWESVGPDRGVYQKSFDGWVDPNCLMIDKLACEPVLRWWTIPLQGDARAMTADHHVFHYLKRGYRVAATDRATVYYLLTPTDSMYAARLSWMGAAYDEAAAPQAG